MRLGWNIDESLAFSLEMYGFRLNAISQFLGARNTLEGLGLLYCTRSILALYNGEAKDYCVW